MKKDQSSYSASIITYCRAHHSAHGEPRIFDDFLADRLLTDKERASFEEMIYKSSKGLYYMSSRKAFPTAVRFVLPGHWQRSIKAIAPDDLEAISSPASAVDWYMQAHGAPALAVSRARYAEDNLAEAVEAGVGQYVILGAGMDTFAFRCPEMMKQLRVFEVDHPATQAVKRERIAELGWDLPDRLHFVAADFNRHELGGILNGSSYDAKCLSFFNWLGVSYYLPWKSVLATLRTVADIAPPGSTIVFDYLDRDIFDHSRVSPRGQWLLWSHAAGEKMQSGFDPSRIARDLSSLGLRLQETLSPSDIERRYFQGQPDSFRPQEHAHFARAVVE